MSGESQTKRTEKKKIQKKSTAETEDIEEILYFLRSYKRDELEEFIERNWSEENGDLGSFW
jgi:hypothetical protein